MTTQRKYRKFSVQFKTDLVQQIERGEIRPSDAIKKYELSPTMLSQWRRQLKAGLLVEGPTKREKELERELEKYKILLAE